MPKNIIIIDTESGFVENFNHSLKVQQLDKDYRLIQLAPKTIGGIENIKENCLEKVDQFSQESDIYAVFVDLSFGEETTDNLGISVGAAIKETYPLIPTFIITNKNKNDRDYDNLSEASLEDLDGFFVKSYLFGTDFSKSRFENIFAKALKKINSRIQKPYLENERFDIAIVTALHDPEMNEVKKIFETEPQKINKEKFQISDSTIYKKAKLIGKNRSLNVVFASDDRMGMSSAASVASKLIIYFKPKYVVMLGIAAGIEGNTHIGDILIPSHTFDYGSGKLKVTKIKKEGSDEEIKIDSFVSYTEPYTMSETFNQQFKGYRDADFLDEIRKNFVQPQTQTISLHVGPFGSGAAVIANSKVPKELLEREGKLIGFDMEAYGVCAACRGFTDVTPIIIKAVSDFANEDKNNPNKDLHQKYAAYVSASFFKEFAQREL